MDTPVKVSLDAYRRPGVCWHCGAPNTPLRKVRLAKVNYLFQWILGESCHLAVPICETHRHPNLLWHYLRVTATPLSVLIFAFVMVAFPEEVAKHSFAALGLSLCPSLGYYLGIRILLARRQTFRPHVFNVRTVEVCFNDPERARAIAEDLATVQAAEPAPPPGERPTVNFSFEEISLG